MKDRRFSKSRISQLLSQTSGVASEQVPEEPNAHDDGVDAEIEEAQEAARTSAIEAGKSGFSAAVAAGEIADEIRRAHGCVRSQDTPRKGHSEADRANDEVASSERCTTRRRVDSKRLVQGFEPSTIVSEHHRQALQNAMRRLLSKPPQKTRVRSKVAAKAAAIPSLFDAFTTRRTMPASSASSVTSAAITTMTPAVMTPPPRVPDEDHLFGDFDYDDITHRASASMSSSTPWGSGAAVSSSLAEAKPQPRSRTRATVHSRVVTSVPKTKLQQSAARSGGKYCQGRPGEICVFGRNGQGGRAEVKKPRSHCMFCDRDYLYGMCADKDINMVIRSLKTFPADMQRKALEYVAEEHVPYINSKLAHSKRCQGRGKEKCIYALTFQGGAAQTHGKKLQCMICNLDALAEACENESGIESLRQSLKLMQPLATKSAIEKCIPEKYRERFADLLPHHDQVDEALPPPGRRRRRMDVDAEGALTAEVAQDRLREAREAWRSELLLRQSTHEKPSATAKTNFITRMAKVRATNRKKFKQRPVEEAGENEVLVGTGLPAAQRSLRAADLERWCVAGSWAVCEHCHVMIAQDMKPATFDKVPKTTITQNQCWRCKAKRQIDVPLPDSVPDPLKGLDSDTQRALAPFEIDVGPELRSMNSNGYRQHASMIVFKWHAESVHDRLLHLHGQSSDDGMAAYEWLLQNNPPYKEFIDEHALFLRKYPSPTEKQRKRWLRIIEREGLECGCWPHLFWAKELCFSWERYTDPRRAEKRRKTPTLEERLNMAYSEETDEEKALDPYAEEADDEDDGTRHSVRRNFAAKVLGPHLDYGSMYEILHYVYDLTLWSDIGSKKNLGYETSMRVMMKHHVMSPMYWHSLHCALIDMIRQCGYPRIYGTMAPYEKSFPYHTFIEDWLAKCGCERTRLPIPETLHMTHVMTQIVLGLLTGSTATSSNHRHRRQWQRHIIKSVDTEGKPMRIAFLLRVEFQDGTHKAATQDYHASGRPHIHFIICFEKASGSNLEQEISASIPDDNEQLEGYVRDSQSDNKGRTPWTINDGPSRRRADGALELHHTHEDHRLGIRAYFLDIMEGVPCHQDVQECDDDGALRAYLVKYPVKFSDSASDEWFNDAHGGDAIAQTVLFRYRPYEPEMILQLFGGRFRQWRCNSVSGGKRDFIVPLPDDEQLPSEVDLYERCTWRSDNMSLLEFLRKSNHQGHIIHWLKKRYDKAAKDGTFDGDVNSYANDFKMFGEKLVAAEMLSWRNDKHCGQWLVLHVPFRNIKIFLDPSIDEKIPREHRYLAMAMCCRHPIAQRMWCNEQPLRDEMKLEGHKKKYIDNIIRDTMANRNLVEKYFSGELLRGIVSEDVGPAASKPTCRLPIQQVHEEDIRSGAKTIEGRVNDGPAAAIQIGDKVLLGNTCVRILDVIPYNNFREMLEACGVEQALPRCSSIAQGVKVYHGFRGYERKAAQYGVLAFKIEVDVAQQVVYEDLTHEQKRYVDGLRDAVEHAFRVHEAPTEADAEAIALEDQSKIQVCFGIPGSGKTMSTYLVVEEVLARGGRVLISVYTAALASRIRQRYSDHPRKAQLRIDTCHAVFGLDEPFVSMPILASYQLIVIDEVSQLQGEHSDRIIRLRDLVDQVPAMAMMGDKWQMAGYGDLRPWDTRLWQNATYAHKLIKAWRCKDEEFQKILDMLRTAKPTADAWGWFQHNFLRTQKAWRGQEPTVADMRRLLTKYPKTTFLAVTRQGTFDMDEMCVQAKYPRREPLAILPGDIESAPWNYDENGKLKKATELEPRKVYIHKGMRLHITRNVRKDVDYVNGMLCTVESYDASARAIIVTTATNRRFAITLWCDEKLGDLEYYPIKPGFASTIIKLQGAELPHVVVYLDCPHAAGAAYTAMSRVSYKKDCLIGGIVRPEHFTPAR